MSQTVQTQFGTGTVVDHEVVRGRVSYKVEGPGFSTWIEAAAMPLDFQMMPHPDDVQDNSVTLPYNPEPQTWVNPADQNIVPGDQAINPDKRTAPADSVDLQADGESYEPGPDPRLFATGGLSPEDIQAKLGPKYVNAFHEHDFTSLQARIDENPELVMAEYRERVAELVAQADQEHLERVGRNEHLEASDHHIREAAWKDVRAKAVRLRHSGQVMTHAANPDVIAAQVTGDHGTYEVMVIRSNIFQGSSAVDSWTCECPWGQWAWKREHAFVGRMCSHAYASLMELQSLSKSKKPNPKFRNQPTVWASRTAESLENVIDYARDNVYDTLAENGLDIHDPEAYDLIQETWRSSLGMYEDMYGLEIPQDVYERYASRTAAYDDVQPVIEMIADMGYAVGYDLHFSSMSNKWVMESKMLPEPLRGTTKATFGKNPWAGGGYSLSWTGKNLQFDSVEELQEAVRSLLSGNLASRTAARKQASDIDLDDMGVLVFFYQFEDEGLDVSASGDEQWEWLKHNVDYDILQDKIDLAYEYGEISRSDADAMAYDLQQTFFGSRTAEIVDLRPVGWDPYSRSLMNKLRTLTDEGSRPGRQKERNDEIRELVTELRERGFDTNGIIASHEAFMDRPYGYGDIPDYGTTLDYILDHEVQKREDVEEPEFEYPAGGEHGVVNDINDGGGERTAALSLPKGTQVQRLNLDGSLSGQTGVVSRDHQGLTEWDQVTVLWDGDSQPSLNDFSEIQWGEYEDGTPTKRLDDPWNIHGANDDYFYGEPPAYDSGDEYGGGEDPFYVDPMEREDFPEDDIVANFQRNAGWLMGNDGGSSGGNDDIAAAAEAHLRTAGRHFTMAEQQALIDEDDGKPYDRSGLRLDGTHYL